MVVKTPEWKFKTNIARNAHLWDARANFLPELGQKMGEKTDYFQEFHRTGGGTTKYRVFLNFFLKFFVSLRYC